MAELGDRDPARLAALEASCTALAAAFRDSPIPFLSAYPGTSWPVDSVVAMAALAAAHYAGFNGILRSCSRRRLA